MKYIANCKENGESFFVIFKSSSLSKEKLISQGEELASIWGGRCFSVEPYKGKYVSNWDFNLTEKENLASV